MGGYVVVGGKRQTVRINAETLHEIARILGIERSDQITVLSVAISSRPSPPPAGKAAARSRPRGRAQRSTESGSRRSSARSTRSPRQE
jgi:hypothetical protein